MAQWSDSTWSDSTWSKQLGISLDDHTDRGSAAPTAPAAAPAGGQGGGNPQGFVSLGLGNVLENRQPAAGSGYNDSMHGQQLSDAIARISKLEQEVSTLRMNLVKSGQELSKAQRDNGQLRQTNQQLQRQLQEQYSYSSHCGQVAEQSRMQLNQALARIDMLRVDDDRWRKENREQREHIEALNSVLNKLRSSGNNNNNNQLPPPKPRNPIRNLPMYGPNGEVLNLPQAAQSSYPMGEAEHKIPALSAGVSGLSATITPYVPASLSARSDDGGGFDSSPANSINNNSEYSADGGMGGNDSYLPLMNVGDERGYYGSGKKGRRPGKKEKIAAKEEQERIGQTLSEEERAANAAYLDMLRQRSLEKKKAKAEAAAAAAAVEAREAAAVAAALSNTGTASTDDAAAATPSSVSGVDSVNNGDSATTTTCGSAGNDTTATDANNGGEPDLASLTIQ